MAWRDKALPLIVAGTSGTAKRRFRHLTKGDFPVARATGFFNYHQEGKMENSHKPEEMSWPPKGADLRRILLRFHSVGMAEERAASILGMSVSDYRRELKEALDDKDAE